MREYLTRAEIRSVACPECGAEPNERCWGRLRSNGTRVRRKEVNHLARMRLAEGKVLPMILHDDREIQTRLELWSDG